MLEETTEGTTVRDRDLMRGASRIYGDLDHAGMQGFGCW